MPVRKWGAGEAFAIPVFGQDLSRTCCLDTVKSEFLAYNYCRGSRGSLEDYDVEA